MTQPRWMPDQVFKSLQRDVLSYEEACLVSATLQPDGSELQREATEAAAIDIAAEQEEVLRRMEMGLGIK